MDKGGSTDVRESYFKVAVGVPSKVIKMQNPDEQKE